MNMPTLLNFADNRADSPDSGIFEISSTASDWLADVAVQALIDEAELTPKPALVDQRGSGAHVDLDLSLMRESARSLKPGFAAMARTATLSLPDVTLRERLGAIGRDAEQAMLCATHGSNAHRGAIWILGLLVASAAINRQSMMATGARLACLPDRHAPMIASHGLRVRTRYGAQGARGEAVAGFPHVFNVGLPALQAARARGNHETHARLNALVAIMAQLEDTCLLHRGGTEALMTAQQGAGRVLLAGGVSTTQGWNALLQLDDDLIARNASPGGAADLLAATLFVDRVGRSVDHSLSPSQKE